MRLQALLAWSAVRRGWGAPMGVVVVVALGLGVSLTSIEAADRTDSAYPDYLERAEVADLVVNPVLATARTQEIIEGTPGVRRVVSDSLLTAGPTNLSDELVAGQGGNEASESATLFLQVRMSQDGRYLDQDRPIVRAGRMIRAGREAFVDTETAEELGIEVGDEVPLTFVGLDPDDPAATQPTTPIGSTPVRVVGTGTFADSVLPDELFPRARILVTPGAAAEFDCLQATPDPEDTRPLPDLIGALFSFDCAMSYRYYSIDVEGGPEHAAEVAAELTRRFEIENRELPEALRAADIGYNVIPEFTVDDIRGVRQSLSPAVAALRAFGASAGVATLATVLVLVVRQLRRRQADLAILRSLGLGPVGRAVGVGVVPIAAVVTGMAGAVIVALVAAPVGPVATARSIDPDPGRSLGAPALLVAAGALGLLVLATVVLALRSGFRDGAPVSPRHRAGWESGSLGSPLVRLGLRAALRGRDSATALVGAAAAVAAITATLVFGVALGPVVDQPERFGWPFDLAVLANAGYGTGMAEGPFDLEAVADDLDRPDVEGWGTATLTGSLTFDGETVPAIAGRAGFDPLVAGTSVLDGRLPVGDDELALGATTARDLGREVGDEVMVTSLFGEQRATVSGIVVMPDLGPFQSDRTSMGTGVLVPGPLLESTYGGAEEATGMTPTELADSQAGLLVVDLVDGTDAHDLLDDLGDRAAAWDTTNFLVTYPDPVRPATIIDLAAIQGVPSLLAGLFTVAMVGALIAGLASGTRSRRDELLVVRALGATTRQRRASVRVHALTTVVVGLLVGLPTGVVVGRAAFREFAHDLGVAPDVATSPLVLAGVVAGTLLVAVLTAEVLARRAAGQSERSDQISRRMAGPKSSLWT